MNDRFIVGNQPCSEFRPQREYNDFGEWDNRHQCFGPYSGEHQHTCTKLVSFCENCHSDHHQDGWDSCGKPEDGNGY